MRMKKRIFAGVLAASMVVAAFTGCNNDDSAKLSDYSEYVTLGEYKNLDIEVGKADVTDKQMQDAIAEVIKKNTTKEEIKEGIVKDKDSINLDFTGYLDGEAFENGSAKAYDYTVGGGFIKSLNDQLIGLEVGKEYDLDCKFPDDYGVEKLNGQDVVFKVKVNCIYGKDIVPEWNDELVKKASEGKYTTVEAYEKYLKDSLKEQNLAEQKSEYEYEMWAAIIKNCKRNGYPEEQLEKLYNEYYSYYKEYYSYIASYYGQKYDDYLKAMGTTDEKLKDKCMTSAKAELEYMMVSVEIAKVENVEITDEEYESIAEGIVKEYGYDSVDKFEEEYASYGENYLYESFIFDEVNEMLAEANNMVEVDKKTNDKENTEKETEKETEKATSGSEQEITTAAKEEATTEEKETSEENSGYDEIVSVLSSMDYDMRYISNRVEIINNSCELISIASSDSKQLSYCKEIEENIIEIEEDLVNIRQKCSGYEELKLLYDNSFLEVPVLSGTYNSYKTEAKYYAVQASRVVSTYNALCDIYCK